MQLLDNGWILKRHSIVNCLKECEPDVLNTFLCDTGLENPNFAKNMSSVVLWSHRNFDLVTMMSANILL